MCGLYNYFTFSVLVADDEMCRKNYTGDSHMSDGQAIIFDQMGIILFMFCDAVSKATRDGEKTKQDKNCTCSAR